MQLTDQVQIIIQHLIEIPALLPGLGQNHRQMQRYHADVESTHEYRYIRIVRRVHTTFLIPWGKECPTTHGGYHLAILFIHAGNISLTGKTQPVRIHGLGRALHTCFKYLFQFPAGSMQILIIQKYDLREQYRLLTVLLALSFAAHIEHDNGRHLRESSCTDPCRHGNKRIIPSAAGYGIEFIFPTLEPLFKLLLHILKRFRSGRLLVDSQPHIFLDIPLIRFLRIRF